jgi:hypothetical protein
MERLETMELRVRVDNQEIVEARGQREPQVNRDHLEQRGQTVNLEPVGPLGHPVKRAVLAQLGQ